MNKNELLIFKNNFIKECRKAKNIDHLYDKYMLQIDTNTSEGKKLESLINQIIDKEICKRANEVVEKFLHKLKLSAEKRKHDLYWWGYNGDWYEVMSINPKKGIITINDGDLFQEINCKYTINNMDDYNVDISEEKAVLEDILRFEFRYRDKIFFNEKCLF
jgi:hypothetical protein